jgi:hypothetical protein
MEEVVDKISVDFHLDKDGKVVDVTSDKGIVSDGEKAHPTPPTAWASAVITTKHSPGCFYIWIGRWIKVCV